MSLNGGDSRENPFSDARAAAADLQNMAKKIHQTSIAWYAEACAAFPANTPEGAMVRGIPVTRRAVKAPKAPEPTG